MRRVLTLSDLLEKIFPHRAAKPFVFAAIAVLGIFFVILLTRLNVTPTQKTTLIIISVLAIWQSIQHKNIDILSLLLMFYGLFLLYSLYRLESLPLLFLMILSAVLVVLLTIWQSHRRFSREVMWRHAYLMGLMAAQISAFFAFWTIFDDVVGKAILSTFIMYALWGFLECEARGEVRWSSLQGYFTTVFLLGLLVLVTMQPTLGTYVP